MVLAISPRGELRFRVQEEKMNDKNEEMNVVVNEGYSGDRDVM